MSTNSVFNEKAAENVVIGQVTQQFKNYGHFGRFRDRCLSGIDNQQNHYDHLVDRIEDATRYFLSIQKWHPQTDKNLLREQLKNFLWKNHSVRSAVQKAVKDVMAREKLNEKMFAVIDSLVRDCLLYYCGETSETPNAGVFDPSNLPGQQLNVTNCAQFYASYPPPAIAFPAPPGRPYFFYPAPGTNMANWSSSSYIDNAHQSIQKQETSYSNNNNNDNNYDSLNYQLERKRETSNGNSNSYKTEQTTMTATTRRDSQLRQNEKPAFYGRSFIHPSSRREKFDDRRRAPYYYDDYYKRRRYDNYDRERSHRRMDDWRYRK